MSDLHEIFLCNVHVTYGRGSVLWRRGDTLCTLGFTDDVICTLVKAARRRHTAEAQRTRSPGLGYKRRVRIPVAGSRRRGLLLAVGLDCSTGGGVCGL